MLYNEFINNIEKKRRKIHRKLGLLLNYQLENKDVKHSKTELFSTNCKVLTKPFYLNV